MAVGVGSTVAVDMTRLLLPYIGLGERVASSATQIRIAFGAGHAELLSGEFILRSDGSFGAGALTGFTEIYAGQTAFDVQGLRVPFIDLAALAIEQNDQGVANLIFGADDTLSGSTQGDLLTGLGGADFIRGLDGNDIVDGGAGNDDVNGNQGVDLVHGGEGADSVRGGQGNDTVYGDGGDDPHVNGNIGDDLVFGGAGADTCFGGQGSDTLSGEDGNDWLSGDLGNDSLLGGAGADRFLFRAGSGVDTVGDFSAAAGDRVQLAPGQAYTLSFTAGGAVVDLGGGDQLVLSGVTQAALGSDWLVFA